jgi:hypothetical protein
MKRFAAALVMALWTMPAMAQGIPLNRLDNCADLKAVSQWLAGSGQAAPARCRKPQNEIEKRELSGWDSPLSNEWPDRCMLAKPVMASLSGFDCLASVPARGHASFFCYRRMNAAPLQAYRENYGQVYARRVATYLGQSGACETVAQATNKARIPGISMSPAAVLAIARPAFAFEVQLRGTMPLPRVEHGFADLDPKLVGGGPSAIEYLAATGGDSMALDRLVQTTSQVGEWVVDAAVIPDLVALQKDADLATARSTAQSAATAARGDDAIDVGGLYLSLTSSARTMRSEDDKAKLLQQWTHDLGAHLKGQGFDPVEEKNLRKVGLDTTLLENNISAVVPYGLKDNASRMTPHFAGAWGGEKASCGSGGGGFLVLALALPAQAGKRSDYGTLALTIMAVSSCRKAKGGPGIAPLISDISKNFSVAIIGHKT